MPADTSPWPIACDRSGVSRDLAALGSWDFGSALPEGICAHPKIDPVTGELMVFRYGFAPPYLTWTTVGEDTSSGPAWTPRLLGLGERPYRSPPT